MRRIARWRSVARDALRPDVVLFGDSITWAWPVPPETNGGRLHRGKPCDTSIQMLGRFEADVVAVRPRLVHIMAGTNDVAENGGPFVEAATLGAIEAMILRAKKAGIAPLVAAVPPVGGFFWNTEIDAVGRIRALNAALARLAARRGAGFVDYRTVLDDGTGAIREGLAYDGVHPTVEGYAAMETVASTAIGGMLDRVRRRPAR